MKKIDGKTYRVLLIQSHGGMCAECKEVVIANSLAVKEALGIGFRYTHLSCYRSLPCFNITRNFFGCVNELANEAKQFRRTYRKYISRLLPISAEKFNKKCTFPRGVNDRVLLEAFKYLEIEEKITYGLVCKSWYEVSWNDELWLAADLSGGSLRTSALGDFLNRCKYCYAATTAKNAYLVIPHLSRVVCKRCGSDKFDLISLYTLECVLGVTQTFLRSVDLPIVVKIGDQEYTFLGSFLSKVRKLATELLTPICTAIKHQEFKLASTKVNQLRKSVFQRSSADLTCIFTNEILVEVAKTSELPEGLWEDFARLFQGV